MRARLETLLRGTIAVLLATAGGSVVAEVGVIHISSEDAPRGPYILGRIIDDPDPNGMWVPLPGNGGSRRVLNPDGEALGDGTPDLAYNETSGLPIVVWSRNAPTGYDVVVSSYDGSNWTEPEVISLSAADDLDPRIAIDPTDGSVHVVYWTAAGPPRVELVSAPADLSSWSAPVPVSEVSGLAVRPSAAFHQGLLHVVYAVHGTSQEQPPRQIVLATDYDGTFVHEVLASSNHGEPIWPRVHSAAGRLWVDWIDSEQSMGWIRYDPVTGWESLQLESYSGVEDRDYLARRRIRGLAID